MMAISTVIQKQQEKVYSIAEYLDMEAVANEKHEFINGKIIAMPGGTGTHSLIASNMITELNNEINQQSLIYYVFNS